jgi:hypothetical protein
MELRVYRVEMTDQTSIRRCTYSIRVQITCHIDDRDALWREAEAIRRVCNNDTTVTFRMLEKEVQEYGVKITD